MPILEFSTNISEDKFSEEFIDRLVDLTASLLNKKRPHISVDINAGRIIRISGTKCTAEHPGAIMRLTFIDAPEQAFDRTNLTKELMEMLEQELGLSPARCILIFNTKTPADIGWNKITAADNEWSKTVTDTMMKFMTMMKQ